MSKQFKRTVYMLLIAIILYSGTMAIPELYYSKYRDLIQGASFGLFVAGILSAGMLIYNKYFKK
ncbi:hypothetical protein FPZ43_05300 [Mucilaginibacter pallidiroseus]|uniref:Uncharacterized protein n=1 Tax=Mucilaginibacter pallidiroseus TaxID=2599295 RepID=A0A563UGF3_9SPHI|nr:hypothetical protein [Mucilaginibacter pallidiroseus]TWR30359.1 hypothetical protein FPZ43_05300 [Mucilaginibacter pallidiroseus]